MYQIENLRDTETYTRNFYRCFSPKFGGENGWRILANEPISPWYETQSSEVIERLPNLLNLVATSKRSSILTIRKIELYEGLILVASVSRDQLESDHSISEWFIFDFKRGSFTAAGKRTEIPAEVLEELVRVPLLAVEFPDQWFSGICSER